MINHGNNLIKDTGTHGVFYGNQPIGVIYKGSKKIYLFQRELTWQVSGQGVN